MGFVTCNLGSEHTACDVCLQPSKDYINVDCPYEPKQYGRKTIAVCPECFYKAFPVALPVKEVNND